MTKEKFTKYEEARILGARALQIAMDAPLLTEISEDVLEGISYNSMQMAKIEFDSGVLPINIKRPLPKKRAVKIVRVVEEKVKDDDVLEKEEMEEKEIVEKGEIMELANPDDESYEDDSLDERASSEELE
jgi:DNA-directed RNA polymerase subunit K